MVASAGFAVAGKRRRPAQRAWPGHMGRAPTGPCPPSRSRRTTALPRSALTRLAP